MNHKLFSTFPVTSNTQYVTQGSTFVAIKGMKEDGVDYIPQAVAAGATTIVVQHGVQIPPATEELIREQAITVMRVADTRLALAQLSAQAHGHPAQHLKIIGITGTKGKSTTTFLLEHILRKTGYKTALLSTVHNKIFDTLYETELTTQQPDYIHAFLHACVERGVTHVVMEVAAQALNLHRVATISFDAVMFLNFSHEHGEFYATQDDYFAAKALLFQQLKPTGIAVAPHGDTRIIDAVKAAGIPEAALRFFATAPGATAASLQGITFEDHGYQYHASALVGNFNIQNARAALHAARWCGITPEQIQDALATFAPVPGRFNKYELPNGALAFIDYAHNPSSFEQVFKMVRPCTKQMIVVFGAGGDRDAAKRPIMGSLASSSADVVFLTTDNPRSEDPAAIIAAIKAGIPVGTKAQVIIEPDREQAIRQAYALSGSGSVILLLGKGPDEYQLVKGAKSYFSEREILQSLGAPLSQQGAALCGFTKKLDTVE